MQFSNNLLLCKLFTENLSIENLSQFNFCEYFKKYLLFTVRTIKFLFVKFNFIRYYSCFIMYHTITFKRCFSNSRNCWL